MGLVAFIMAYALFAFIFYILQVIAYWKIFTKAGEEGWKSYPVTIGTRQLIECHHIHECCSQKRKRTDNSHDSAEGI